MKKRKLREKETKAKDLVSKIKIQINLLKQFYFWHPFYANVSFFPKKKVKSDNKQTFSTPELHGL